MDRQDENCPWVEPSPRGLEDKVDRAGSRRRLIAGGLTAAPVLLALKSQSALAVGVCQTPSGAMSGNLSHGNQLPGSMCAGTGPLTYASFTSGALGNWPSTITPTRLQRRSTNNNDWIDDTTTGLPLSSRFFWTLPSTGSNKVPPGDALRVRTTRSGSVTTRDFGATFVSIFGREDGLSPVLPTPPDPTGSDKDESGSVASGQAVTLWEVLAYPDLVAPGTRGKLAQACVAAYFNALKANQSQPYAITASQVQEIWGDLMQWGSYCPLANCGANPWGESQANDYLRSTFSTS